MLILLYECMYCLACGKMVVVVAAVVVVVVVVVVVKIELLVFVG